MPGAHGSWKVVSGILGLKLNNYEPLPDCWHHNTGPLQEQQMLLAIKTSLRSSSICHTCIHICVNICVFLFVFDTRSQYIFLDVPELPM